MARRPVAILLAVLCLLTIPFGQVHAQEAPGLAQSLPAL